MPLVADSLTIGLSANTLLGKAQRAVSNWFQSPDFSPESALRTSELRDARLMPRVAMSNENIDVGLLNQLSTIGLKRAKQVTEESHPELMQAWKLMAARAGLKTVPQLIIAESPSLNALTINKEEVTITTGLLKILDLRQAVAVLGHELGHVQSDHTSPRIHTTLLFGGAGAILGNELSRDTSAFGKMAENLANKWGPTRKAFAWIHPNGIKTGSVLGGALSISAFASIGAMIGRHFSVRPTELDADAKGAAISGDPAGLASALAALEASSPRKGIATRLAQMQSGYPSTDRRITNLQRMASQYPMQPVMAQIENVPAETPTVAAAPVIPGTKLAVQDIAMADRVGTPIEGPTIH